MSMNISNAAKTMADEYAILLDPDNGDSYDENSFIKILNKALDDEFQNGKVSIDNVDITTQAGKLNIPLTPGSTMAKIIGQEVADYWAATTKTSGTAENECGNQDAVISTVTNTAATIASPIETGIKALYGATEAKIPTFEDFVKVIINNVKTVKWVVVEVGTTGNSACSFTYNVTIS